MILLMWSRLLVNPRRRAQVLGLFILTLGAGALALPSLGRMDLRGVSIIDVELMRTSPRAAELLAQLGPNGIDATQMSIYLDFGFLLFYGLALSAACAVLAAGATARGASMIAVAGGSAAWAAVIAAGFDAIENVALLVVLDGHTNQPWPAIATGFASVKFVLLALVILYLVVGLLISRRGAPSGHPAQSTAL